MLEIHRDNDEEFWLQLAHGVFGVGGFISPMLIGMLEVNGMGWIGLGMLLGFPGYFYLESSETVSSYQKKKEEKQ